KRLSPTMRQEHIAGDKVFVDYSGKKVPIVDRKTGEIREAELFRKRYEWPTGISVDICRVPRPVGFRTSALSAAA
ncbi:hypothetical protein, partial [Rhizobium leguminosarum]|uniref:hypothetical protein n=1 Tax=Rhizobium leguminosarum TaxID=384 RepID=UPI0013B9AD7D